MPYNTRRKSLSLPSLGIHIPVNRTSSNSNSNSNMASSRPAPESSASEHPNKRVKRSHTLSQDSTSSATSASAAPSKSYVPRIHIVKNNHTPPPTPALHRSIESDESELKSASIAGVNDDIVQAIIIRLQETRNRPHLVKDLAAVLMSSVKAIQDSANPCAIISSRISTFMKRSTWTAATPCPLVKELEAVHPRRTYFYLSNCPRLPFPDSSAVESAQSAIVTPSLSSSSSTSEEDVDGDRRRELSLSPEVDLSSPEYEEANENISGTLTGPAAGSHRNFQIIRNLRGDEPPLEKDEKEFTQTADGLQQRRLGGNLLSAEPIGAPVTMDDGIHTDLFGDSSRYHQLVPTFYPHMAFMTSPAMRPSIVAPPKRDGESEAWAKLNAMLDWDKSPETIELEELDGMLNDF